MKPLLHVCAFLLLAWATAANAFPFGKSKPGPEELIATAEKAIAADDHQAAEQALTQLPAGSLDIGLLARSQLVRAEIGRLRQQPEVVLRALPASSAHVPSYAPRMELLRAQALFETGDALGAVARLVERERWLNGEPALATNRELIWNGLLAAPLSGSVQAQIPHLEARVRGWLDLAKVLQDGPTDPALAAWAARNPNHPAAEKANLVRASTAVLGGNTAVSGFQGAGGYAVLLPLSGNLALSSRALRDGLVSAWYELPTPRPALRFYDTGSTQAQAVAAVQTAVRDGAAILIGPLTKDGVTAVAGAGTGGLPWLALNQLDQPLPGAVQFALAPEDEARAAARSAVAKGRTRALVLAPDNDWGQRSAAAFEAELRAQGGEVLESVRYRAGAQDFGTPLKNLMNLDQSSARHRALETALGEPSEFEPRPRGDAEFLFAPMRPAEARVLIPQLEFFRAQRLPVYAPAAALAGGNRSDLESLRLCDMPWVLASNGALAETRERARAQFPEALREQPRLFALGADALAVARAWQAGALVGGRMVEGLSGRLSLDSAQGRITRDLDCSNLRDGT